MCFVHVLLGTLWIVSDDMHGDGVGTMEEDEKR